MRLSKKLSTILFGSDTQLSSAKGQRGAILNFPGIAGERSRQIHYRTDDGIILNLLKRIEDLESAQFTSNEKRAK